MKRMLSALGLALGLSTTPAAAQIGFVLGGGATIPMGDFGDVAKTGWMGLAGVRLALPLMPIQFRAEGLFGRNTHDVGLADDKTTLYGGMANVMVSIGPPLVPVKPYIIAGAGAMNAKIEVGGLEGSEWKPVFGGGVGVNVSLMVVGLFVEARYLRRDDVGFLPIMAGVRLGG